MVFDAGSVRYTDMKGRGTAVVRFNSERDAQRAVGILFSPLLGMFVCVFVCEAVGIKLGLEELFWVL